MPDGRVPGAGPGDVALCSSTMTELTARLAPDRLTADRAAALIDSWELVLRAERKSPRTIKVYGDGLRRYLLWCAEQGAGPMDRISLNQWVAGLLDQGAAAGTAGMRKLAVRRFTGWLIVEGRLPADPFHGMTAPKVDQPVVDPLTDDELRALIRACARPLTEPARTSPSTIAATRRSSGSCSKPASESAKSSHSRPGTST